MTKKETDTGKLKALQLTLDKIEKSYGKGAIMKMGDEVDVEIGHISTGSIGLKSGFGYRWSAPRKGSGDLWTRIIG
jgi:recombination protein RecA